MINTRRLLRFLSFVSLAFWAKNAPAQTIVSGCPSGNWSALNNCQWLQVPVTIPPVKRLPEDGDVASIAAIQGTFTLDVNSPNLSGLFISSPPGANGTFLQPGFTLRSDSEGIGPFGTFSQTGGANIIGGALTLTATYNLQGANTTLSANTETINQVDVAANQASAGLFTQNDGTNTVGATLTIGSFGLATNGTYDLNGGLLSANGEIVGAAGTGTFNHLGGLNTVGGTLTLGATAGGVGTYNLSGATPGAAISTLSTQSEVIGNLGSGTFTQSFGTNTVSNTMSLGDQAGANGSYTLSGGAVSASTELVGNAGTGTFNQTDGKNTISKDLSLGDSVGGSGTYNLSGGTITIPAAIGGSGITVGRFGSGVFNQSGGDIFQSDLLLAPNSSADGTYNQTGGTNNIAGSMGGGNLGVAVDESCAGNPLPCGAGRATYTLSGTATLSVSSREIVGGFGTGRFVQNGGTNTAGGLSLGENGGSGTYALGAGKLAAGNEGIGIMGGIGTFNQSGGTNVTGEVDINFGSSAANPNDVYNLSGSGVLSAGTITNRGTFNYSGGTLTGIFLNGNGANFNISGAGTRVINGTLTNAGTVTVFSDKAQFFNVTLTTGVFSVDPSTVQFQNLNVGAAGVITGVAGDIFAVTGNFQNLSTQNTLWSTSASQLDFTGGGTHTFDLAGQNGAGFTNNFAWGSLVIDPGNTLDLAAGSGDALYAFFLQGLDISGNTITNVDGTPGLFLYYNAADNPFLNGNYNLTGGGELIALNGAPPQTPEPSTWLLMASGLSLLIGRRRWRNLSFLNPDDVASID